MRAEGYITEAERQAAEAEARELVARLRAAGDGTMRDATVLVLFKEYPHVEDRLELRVGENIELVLLDRLAHEPRELRLAVDRVGQDTLEQYVGSETVVGGEVGHLDRDPERLVQVERPDEIGFVAVATGHGVARAAKPGMAAVGT